MSRLPALLALLMMASACYDDSDLDDDDSGGDGIEDDGWGDLLDRREEALIDLGDPVLDCVGRSDTAHAAFHGCIDWHSAVHGTWALHVLARLLDEPAYLDAADDVLDPEAVAAELEVLDEGAIGWEIPYGYSWFLALAREREEAGRDDLRGPADIVAADLEGWLDARSDADLELGVLNDNYGNASWVLLNLHDWAEHVEDDALRARMESLAARVWLPMDGRCPVESEAEHTQQFFPPCLHRMMALAAVLPEGPDRGDWLDRVAADAVPTLAPVDDPTTAHGAGLNFSRAWGLWSLWEATEDPAWRSLYAEHVLTHLDRPEYWGEDYRAHSHWIPQFGIRALSLSFE